jgi:hypothetical protein
MIEDMDVLEAYLLDVVRFTPARPTYLREMAHWHKTPAKRTRDLGLRGRLNLREAVLLQGRMQALLLQELQQDSHPGQGSLNGR